MMTLNHYSEQLSERDVVIRVHGKLPRLLVQEQISRS
jgi:hypothetical protein